MEAIPIMSNAREELAEAVGSGEAARTRADAAQRACSLVHR